MIMITNMKSAIYVLIFIKFKNDFPMKERTENI